MDTPELTPIVTRRLRIARGAFRQGVRLRAGSPGASTRVASLISLDFAAETTLKSLVQQVTNEDLRKLRFYDLIKRVEALLTEMAIAGVAVGALNEVHETRNAAQHQARVPTSDELVAAEVHVRDSLEDFCQAVWDIGFDIAETDEIVTDRLRAGLENAVTAREVDGDPTAAAGWARAAVDLAVERFIDELAGTYRMPMMLPPSGHSYPRSPSSETINRLAQQAYDNHRMTDSAIARLRTATAVQALGIDVRTWIEFRGQLDRAPDFNINGVMFRREGEHSFTDQEAADLTGFAVDLVLRAEEVAGSLVDEL